ncbi:MAG: energy transducer TonB [Reyranella sp.]|uniref:energy transducer TonB n=1 Tax=Reyranella sp. TaxID=1929291 RepID=UPI0012005957|nr:energy transducer TonB [Reyranella sp.]TAJ91326.1 MAG: energy transducer TonB [Reyranella sp.]TBR30318.1 MAG: energy transducer TonB [Reyranella sp.]
MVVPAALSAERLPAPPARGPRVSVALSLALHGLAIVPLLLAGISGSSANDDEPALMVELSLAAPTTGAAAEADQPETTPEPQQQPELPTPPAEQTEATPPPEPEPPPPQEVAAAEPEIKVELPPPDEPPPPTAAELKPAEPPKPKPPQAKPAAAPRPTAQAAVTKAPVPDAGNASITQQQAASSSSLIVFEGKPRYRIPPTPAVYPPRSIELGQQGEVMVRVRLDPDGTAAEIMVWRSSSFPLLDRAALTAVRGWHFLPALRDGRPVAAWVEIPVRFHLR